MGCLALPDGLADQAVVPGFAVSAQPGLPSRLEWPDSTVRLRIGASSLCLRRAVVEIAGCLARGSGRADAASKAFEASRAEGPRMQFIAVQSDLIRTFRCFLAGCVTCGI